MKMAFVPPYARIQARGSATNFPPPDLLSRARGKAAAHGLEISSVTYEGAQQRLRVIIQHPSRSVSADDCALISAQVDALLESEEDCETEGPKYTLEVSTPGVSDVLVGDVARNAFRGFPVLVTVREEGRDEIHRGSLGVCGDGLVAISKGGRVARFRDEHVVEITLCTEQDVRELQE